MSLNNADHTPGNDDHKAQRQRLITYMQLQRYTLNFGPLWLRKLYEIFIQQYVQKKFLISSFLKFTCAFLFMAVPAFLFVVFRIILPVPERIPIQKRVPKTPQALVKQLFWPYVPDDLLFQKQSLGMPWDGDMVEFFQGYKISEKNPLVLRKINAFPLPALTGVSQLKIKYFLDSKVPVDEFCRLEIKTPWEDMLYVSEMNFQHAHFQQLGIPLEKLPASVHIVVKKVVEKLGDTETGSPPCVFAVADLAYETATTAVGKALQGIVITTYPLQPSQLKSQSWMPYTSSALDTRPIHWHVPQLDHLQQQGFATVSIGRLKPPESQGSDLDDTPHVVGFQDHIFAKSLGYNLRFTTEKALDWVQEHAQQPFFAHVHYALQDFNGRFLPPAQYISFWNIWRHPFGARPAKEFYKAAVGHFDDELKIFRQQLKAIDLLDNIDILIASSETLPFGRHTTSDVTTPVWVRRVFPKMGLDQVSKPISAQKERLYVDTPCEHTDGSADSCLSVLYPTIPF